MGIIFTIITNQWNWSGIELDYVAFWTIVEAMIWYALDFLLTNGKPMIWKFFLTSR